MSCWEWTGTRNYADYGITQIDGRQIRAHRLSYELFNGTIPKGRLVLHHCDNPPCVNPKHLYIGTDVENVRDRVRRSRSACGENNGISKLTESKVRDIRSNSDVSLRIMADKYSVDKSLISQIRNKKVWKQCI